MSLGTLKPGVVSKVDINAEALRRKDFIYQIFSTLRHCVFAFK